MNETNELNDIILNKGGSTNNNKKIILAVATLGVILIIVVMLMNSLTSSGTDNLPQAVLPPKAKTQDVQQDQDEPLFEEVEVVQETSKNNNNLDKIAKKLKEESKTEVVVAEETVIKPKPVVKPKPQPVVKPKVVETPKAQVATVGSYYIQVGSFSKYEPNKKFLKSISDLGYSYKYHKVTKDSKTLNKVLVGPFDTSAKAKDARRTLRAKVEPGAFLIKL
ncbi:SPOR domain-containing protein [Sulfurimonas sp.]